MVSNSCIRREDWIWYFKESVIKGFEGRFSSEDDIIKYLGDRIKSLKNNDKTIKMEKDLNIKLDRYKNDIEINKNCIDKCYNQNLKGLIDDNTFQRQYNLLIEQNNKTFLLIEEIENKLNNIKRKENYTEDKYKNVITEFLSMKKPNRQLLSSLIDRIEIDKDLKITIFYRFKPLF